MHTEFFYMGMWGAYQGNIAYETAYGGRDLLPAQSNFQKRLTQLYCQSRDLSDQWGGRVEGKLKSNDWQQQSERIW